MKKSLILILLMTSFTSNSNDNVTNQAIMETDQGVGYEVTKKGSGNIPNDDQFVSVHYTMWINNNGEPGTKIDSSRDRNLPVTLQIGKSFFRGCDEIVKQMSVGSTYRIYLPPQFGYGQHGLRGIVPPNTHLILDIELLDIK